MIDIGNFITEMASSELDISDILIETNAPIMLKTARGWIQAEDVETPTWYDVDAFLFTIDPSWDAIIRESALNRPLNLSTRRLRVNAYLAFGGTKIMASIRLIPNRPLAIGEAGLPAASRLLLENTSGLILVSGPTGSGKTTSMASMVEAINESRNSHIITIEDPIEFMFERKCAVFSRREIGVDCTDFKSGVKDALRQRPDVVVIGEIRDRETAEQALIAGESGHLVMGTLHAGSALGTISKLLGYFNSQERDGRLQSLSENLVGIIHQTLIPKKEGGGYALAVDFIANHKRQHSKAFFDMEKLQGSVDRNEDGVSIPLFTSIKKLVNAGVVDKTDAMKAVSGNAFIYDNLRQL
ncbi:ATPase, T2SS/T4P/T4SS family [Diaphorobacter sp. LR2014-1]|uniref:type IV pilus twitching motility protein PilT n=1 Tax=Diaphorobacter sp. LR2014-1 TaxID=1933219 RepID=UPI000CDA35DC|nr:ATPase, T2SS/T4P/T4SS family [Diaphorobacter sp. LR2014-1]POR10879.1 hypothetical protein BV908_09125 [Diaphorobacter sp. LR2014-1]